MVRSSRKVFCLFICTRYSSESMRRVSLSVPSDFFSERAMAMVRSTAVLNSGSLSESPRHIALSLLFTSSTLYIRLSVRSLRTMNFFSALSTSITDCVLPYTSQPASMIIAVIST